MECRLHPGRPNNKGYVARHYGGRMEQVHRITWIEENGPIPQGFEIHHTCSTRNCVEITHLRLVTHRENLLLGNTIVARQAAQTHCIHGHLFDEKNTHIRPNGKRQCRACGRDSYHRRKR